jgi:23S rRNA pseudouridine1911/1915/1917 synthase
MSEEPLVPDGPADDLAEEADAASGDAPPRRIGEVPAGRHLARLDVVLVDLAPEYSRTHLQGLIQAGLVQVDGRVAASASHKLRAGQVVTVDLAVPPADRPPAGEPMALVIVHEDADLLVLDKPAGLVVHPAPGNWSGTLLNGLIGRDPAAARLPRGGIVHRLDKDTSGLMVVARTLPAMLALVRALAAREVKREYRAIAHGRPARSPLTIDLPLARDPASRVRMAVVAGGRASRTDVEVLGGSAEFSLLHCRLHTGRTHQIRVHLAAQGCPLVGDRVYGGRPALGLDRQALHAARLAFRHPRDGATLAFESPLPVDLREAWDRVGSAMERTALAAERRPAPDPV